MFSSVTHPSSLSFCYKMHTFCIKPWPISWIKFVTRPGRKITKKCPFTMFFAEEWVQSYLTKTFLCCLQELLYINALSKTWWIYTSIFIHFGILLIIDREMNDICKIWFRILPDNNCTWWIHVAIAHMYIWEIFLFKSMLKAVNVVFGRQYHINLVSLAS